MHIIFISTDKVVIPYSAWQYLDPLILTLTNLLIINQQKIGSLLRQKSLLMVSK